MSKQSARGKLKIKDLYKPLVFFSLIQAVIILLFFSLYNAEVPLDLDSDCKYSSIIVDDKYITEEGKRSSDDTLRIISNGEKFIFSESNYQAKELYEMISIGEKINIYYIEKHGLFGDNNFLIVDARNNVNVYADIDRYNDESISVNAMLFIMFAVFEIIFLALAAFFAPFNWHDVKMKLDMFIHKHRKTKQTEKNDDCASK